MPYLHSPGTFGNNGSTYQPVAPLRFCSRPDRPSLLLVRGYAGATAQQYCFVRSIYFGHSLREATMRLITSLHHTASWFGEQDSLRCRY